MVVIYWAATWCKRLVARFPPQGFRVRVSVTPRGFRGGRIRVWVSFSGFLPFSPVTNFIPQFLYTHLVHFVSFHFIRSCDGASGVVGQYPCYSQIIHIEASSNLIPRSGPVSDTSLGGEEEEEEEEEEEDNDEDEEDVIY